MVDKLRPLPLLEAFTADANEIMTAHKRMKLIHSTGDIRTSGDEVENRYRDIIRKKLPQHFYTGHGHIVDRQLNLSSQLDIIIADNSAAPILFRTENGTEYFPYESVYAFGEIKSTYDKSKKYIERFVDVIRTIKTDLYRERNNTRGEFAISLVGSLPLHEHKTYDNLLFTFMCFASGENFIFDDIIQLYGNTQAEHLPNIVCILDKGVILHVGTNADENHTNVLSSVYLYPEMVTAFDPRWAFLQYGDINARSGSNLAIFWSILATHLRLTKLLPPNMLNYVDQIFSFNSGVAFIRERVA